MESSTLPQRVVSSPTRASPPPSDVSMAISRVIPLYTRPGIHFFFFFFFSFFFCIHFFFKHKNDDTYAELHNDHSRGVPCSPRPPARPPDRLPGPGCCRPRSSARSSASLTFSLPVGCARRPPVPAPRPPPCARGIHSNAVRGRHVALAVAFNLHTEW